MPTIYIGLSAALVIAAVTAFVFHRLVTSSAAVEAPVDFLNTFSPERYRPMLQLLSEEEFLFLAAQPGYRKDLGKAFRRNRIRIFRAFLDRVDRDFGRLHAAARAALVCSPDAQTDLASLLVRQRLTYLRATLAIEFRLGLYRLGLAPMQLPGMVELLEGMRSQLAAAAPQTAPAIR